MNYDDLILAPAADLNDEPNSGDDRYAGPGWDHETRLEDLQGFLKAGPGFVIADGTTHNAAVHLQGKHGSVALTVTGSAEQDAFIVQGFGGGAVVAIDANGITMAAGKNLLFGGASCDVGSTGQLGDSAYFANFLVTAAGTESMSSSGAGILTFAANARMDFADDLYVDVTNSRVGVGGVPSYLFDVQSAGGGSLVVARGTNAGGDVSYLCQNAGDSNAATTMSIITLQANRYGGSIVFGRENAASWTTSVFNADGFISFNPVVNGVNTEAGRFTSAGNLQMVAGKNILFAGASCDIGSTGQAGDNAYMTKYHVTTAGTEYVYSSGTGILDINADVVADASAVRINVAGRTKLTIQRFPGVPTYTLVTGDTGFFFDTGGGEFGFRVGGTSKFKCTSALNLSFQVLRFRDNIPIGLGSGTSDAAPDATIYYNATNLIIDPNVIGTGAVYIGATANDNLHAAQLHLGAAGTTHFSLSGTDILVTTPANKTLQLSQPVYDDIYIGFASAKVPAANAPNWENFVGNIPGYTFAVNDYLNLDPVELEHTYQEDSNFIPHVHWVTNGTEGVAKYVKWEIEYTIANSDAIDGVGDVFPNTVVLSAETEIPADTPDLNNMYTSMAAITGTDFNIGAILKTRIRRIASTGAAPAANPFGDMIGVHIAKDTQGSRQELVK